VDIARADIHPVHAALFLLRKPLAVQVSEGLVEAERALHSEKANREGEREGNHPKEAFPSAKAHIAQITPLNDDDFL
jgi:hypothetical protein